MIAFDISLIALTLYNYFKQQIKLLRYFCIFQVHVNKTFGVVYVLIRYPWVLFRLVGAQLKIFHCLRR